jgi:hypothetical protein
MLKKMKVLINLLILLLCLICVNISFAQTNSRHVHISGHYRSNGTYVQPYFRTAPNSTNRDNFSTTGNVNPYTGKPGWISPDSKYNTFYQAEYTYVPKISDKGNTSYSGSQQQSFESNTTLLTKHKDRAYIEDEHGNYTCYLTLQDERTYKIYNMDDVQILYLVVNHRGDWRLFNTNGIYIKTIFINQ